MTTTTCGKCGSVVRLDHSACPACGEVRSGTSVRAAAAAAPRREDVEIEVRARLMWGESPEGVRADFLRKGVRSVELDVVLRKAVEERKKYYRNLGLKNLIGGAVLFALGLAFLLISNAFFKGEGEIRRLPIWMLIAGITAPVSGILLMVKGGRRMGRPGEGERETEAHTEGD